MPLLKEVKKDIIENFKIHETDTGSCEIQIAFLTQRINNLIEHLKTHSKDHHSRRGILILVGRRKRLLNYLGDHNSQSYNQLAKKLNLKTAKQQIIKGEA